MADNTRATIVIGAGLLLSFAASLNASAWAINGSGKTKSETRKLPPYHSIVIKLPAEIVCDAAKTNELSIEADDNLLPHIKTTVTNGVLLIQNDESFNNSHKMQFKAKAESFDGLDASGAVNATVNNPAKNKFDLNAEGASKVTLNNLAGGNVGIKTKGASAVNASGKADNLTATIEGAGALKATSLEAKSATVSLKGASSAEVNAVNELKASIEGVGSIKYKGNPKVTKQIKGLGSVSKI